MGYKINRIMMRPGGVEKQVRPVYKPRTFTISRTEQSNMSSGWTYSDDAAGLTAGSGAFDDFFGYSAVLLNTSGVETAEMKQSGGVFTGAMSTLGNITSGDNVMIKFPVRGIKMSKSGSVVTLSITEELDKAGYQYYAHCTGTLSNPGTPKDAFYLGAYEGCNSSGTLKSRSGASPLPNQTSVAACTSATNNGTGYNIIGYYQRQFVNCLYMMKYGNPDSQSVVGMGYVGASGRTTTGGTDNQTNATYGTSSSTTQCKLFGLEDRWGNVYEWVGGAYTNRSKTLSISLSGYTGYASGGESTGGTAASTNEIISIAGDNNRLFCPTGSTNNYSYNTYYCDYSYVVGSRVATAGGAFNESTAAGALTLNFDNSNSDSSGTIGTRLRYLSTN